MSTTLTALNPQSKFNRMAHSPSPALFLCQLRSVPSPFPILLF